LDRLRNDRQLLRLCGWNNPSQLPHESTFSRAFEEFALTQLPQRLHEAMIAKTQKDRLIGHIARDSTAIIDPVQRYRVAGQKAGSQKIMKGKRQPIPCELAPAERQRFRQRTSVERVNARLKDHFDARSIHYRGADKIMAQLMFAVLALSVDQWLKLSG
jgi:hypothetical protein